MRKCMLGGVWVVIRGMEGGEVVCVAGGGAVEWQEQGRHTHR